MTRGSGGACDAVSPSGIFTGVPAALFLNHVPTAVSGQAAADVVSTWSCHPMGQPR